MFAFASNSQITLILVLWCLEPAASKPPRRVLGGRDAAPGELPYVVSVEVHAWANSTTTHAEQQLHLCTATVLTPTWALTAAHCIQSLRHVLAAIASDPNMERPTGVIRLKSVIESRTNNDSFGEIVSTYTYPAYKTIDYLAFEFSVTKGDVGLLKTRLWPASQLAKPLQVLDVVIKSCDESVRDELYPALCISRRCGQLASLCPGDSGGPLVHASGVVAINTLADVSDCYNYFKKISTNKVGMLTPISPYLDWIVNSIAKDVVVKG